MIELQSLKGQNVPDVSVILVTWNTVNFIWWISFCFPYLRKFNHLNIPNFDKTDWNLKVKQGRKSSDTWKTWNSLFLFYLMLYDLKKCTPMLTANERQFLLMGLKWFGGIFCFKDSDLWPCALQLLPLFHFVWIP